MAMLCNDCHLNDKTRKLTGRRLDEVSKLGTIYSKNITNDPIHGIGKMTDGLLYYLLRRGVRPDGIPWFDTRNRFNFRANKIR